MTKLKEKRLEKGLTQTFIAEQTNISIGAYNMYENNQRKIPLDRAERIAEILDCEINDIFLPSYFTMSEIK